MKKYTPCGGCGATEPDQRCIGCMHPFTEEEEKEQVKKGIAIIGHGSSNEEDDQLKFSIERGDLWKHRAISAELELEELKKKPDPVWVKAKERLPGWKKRVKWRDGNNHSYATDGEISLFEMEKPNLEGWEWYDESAAGREDDWIDVNDSLPEESGRYWCYVEQLTDLGFSYFQWNCDYNSQLQRFSDMTLKNGERITNWRPLAKPPKFKQQKIKV